MTAQPPASGPLALAYWDTKAATYPAPDEPGPAAQGAALRAAAQALGACFDGAAILDVGAGTGLHALAFAVRAARVVAVDLSEAMLAPLRARKPPSLEVHRADFMTVDLAAAGWLGAFDLVWACMTPVSGDAAGLARLDAASRAQVCCVTWGARRDDPVVTEAFRLHGATFSPPNWRAAIVAHNDALGRAVAHVSRPMTVSRRTPPEALAVDLAAHLRWLGVTPDTTRLAAFCEGLAEDGLVSRRIVADQDIWLWRVDG